MTEPQKKKALKLAKSLGSKAMDNFSAAKEKVALKKDQMKHGPLKKIWDQVSFIWDCVQSVETPPHFKTILIGSLLYMIMPFDVIPDFVPVVGLLDDAAVIGLVYTQIKKIFNAAAPLVKQGIQDKVVKELKGVLDKIQKKMLITMLVKFVVFCMASALLFFFPRSTVVFLISSILILATVLFSIVAFCINIPTYAHYVRIFFREKTFDKTVIAVLSEMTNGIKGRVQPQIAQFFITAWANGKIPDAIIPAYPEFKQHIWDNFKHRIIITVVLFILYGLVLVLFIRPWLLSLSGHSIWQIYFFSQK